MLNVYLWIRHPTTHHCFSLLEHRPYVLVRELINPGYTPKPGYRRQLQRHHRSRSSQLSPLFRVSISWKFQSTFYTNNVWNKYQWQQFVYQKLSLGTFSKLFRIKIQFKKYLFHIVVPSAVTPLEKDSFSFILQDLHYVTHVNVVNLRHEWQGKTSLSSTEGFLFV